MRRSSFFFFADPSCNVIFTTYLLLFMSSSQGLRQIPLVTDTQQENPGKPVLVEHYVTGSTLPDCTHACGPCSPCRRVMVSFKCSETAESCPMVYRCMCHGRYYHVPSN